MTAAALVPLAFLALMTLIVVLAVRSLSNSKRDDAADADFAWMPEPETYSIAAPPLRTAVPSPSEPPPTAEVIRMPVRLYVVQGGRR